MDFYALIKHYKWQEKEEKAEKLKLLHQRQSQNHQELVFNSPSEELADFSDTPTTLKESELVPPSISLQSLSTWLLRSWNWQETLLRTTRRPELSPDTFFWPLETTRNSTNCCTMPPLLREVSYQTSAAPFQVPSKAAESHPKLFDRMEFIMSTFKIYKQTPSFNYRAIKEVFCFKRVKLKKRAYVLSTFGWKNNHISFITITLMGLVYSLTNYFYPTATPKLSQHAIKTKAKRLILHIRQAQYKLQK